jgi:hypothetical protein
VLRPRVIPGLALSALIVSAPVISSSQAPAALVAEVAPTGRLRAGINYNNPVLARRDAVTGEVVVAPAASAE